MVANRIEQLTIARGKRPDPGNAEKGTEAMDGKRAFDMVVSVLKLVLTSEQIKSLECELFDLIERKVKESPNKVDDALILPVLGVVRAALGVVHK